MVLIRYVLMKNTKIHGITGTGIKNICILWVGYFKKMNAKK